MDQNPPAASDESKLLTECAAVVDDCSNKRSCNMKNSGRRSTYWHSMFVTAGRALLWAAVNGVANALVDEYLSTRA